jgi:hypothetical protein
MIYTAKRLERRLSPQLKTCSAWRLPADPGIDWRQADRTMSPGQSVPPHRGTRSAFPANVYERYCEGGREKSTFGATFALSGTWNSGYSLKPKTLAVIFPGNCRRDVLYCCTRSL